MSAEFVDFQLSQGYGNTQLLTLAQDTTYPPYEITLHGGGASILPSLVSFTPDVSISHRAYLAPSFVEATFHKYRNGLSITYPETALRTPEGDVTTTVEDVLPPMKQDIKCESLGDRQYSFELDLGKGRREQHQWYPPRKGRGSGATLELRRVEDDRDEVEPLAKIVKRHWGVVGKDKSIAVVRVREDFIDEQGVGRRGSLDQILATAVALIERLRRRAQYLSRPSALGY